MERMTLDRLVTKRMIEKNPNFWDSQKHPTDFVIKEAIGDIAFNVVSPSIFHPDGPMIMQSDKAQVVFLISNGPLPDGH